MSIDRSMHSLFGVSKAAADLMVQEYGRYFDMPTVCFRGGCLTGPSHAGAQLHGFLSYLMRCTVTGEPYTVFGYDGKQVRDNIHSADVVQRVRGLPRAPRAPAPSTTSAAGASRNCSMLEAIARASGSPGAQLDWSCPTRRAIGDHRWWITDLGDVRARLPRLAAAVRHRDDRCARSTTPTSSAGRPPPR